MTTEKTALEVISEPLTLPCGLVLPNRLVKCPMQETLAKAAELFDPPEAFSNIYGTWGQAKYGLIITGQVQIDIRFLSVAGDVVVHDKSLEEEHLVRWKKWAEVAQSAGTPTIVQLAHPGRMSPVGAGIRPVDMPALCPSSVPVKLGDTWLDKMGIDKLLGTPKEMTVAEIDEVVAAWVHGAVVSMKAGFAGVQLHGAHGFLLSQFLSPHTNKRTDDYGGSPEKRMKLLQRLVQEIREKCPPPFCLSVKMNSADYMAQGGLGQDEALKQVIWLAGSGLVDFVEISGGNAEATHSGLQNSFDKKSIDKAPKRSSTRIREAYFTDFAEKVMAIETNMPFQLSGGFRSRIGMADAIASGACQLVGLGRSAILEPELPAKVLLNPDYDDEGALAKPHIVNGLWLQKLIPIKVVGSGLPIQFFYYNMKLLGKGLDTQPDASIPYIMALSIWETLSAGLLKTTQRLFASWGGSGKAKAL